MVRTTERSTTINDLTNSHLVRGNGVSKSILRRERAPQEKREPAWSAVRRRLLATDKGQEEVKRGKQGILLSRHIFYN